jgi:CTP:molybdopterin cytidylyltransferase MocA
MIGGLLLAAGGSSRFGHEPKQLAEFDGRPLIEHPLSVLEAMAVIERVVVVLGANADRIRAEADLGTAEVIVADAWEEGIAASLRAGFAALADADAIVVLLADQPRVTAAAVEAVLAEVGDAPAARAEYAGKPGHPVVIGRELFDEIAALRGDAGARDLLDSHGARTVDCDTLASGYDIDTREDLEGAQR